MKGAKHPKRRDGNLAPLIGGILVSVLVASYALLMMWGAEVCGGAKVKEALLADGRMGCVEYWFNRYQTILTGFAALLAAWMASLPVRGQLKEMSRQSAASARPAMIELAKALEEEREYIAEAMFDLIGVNRLQREYDDRASWPEIYSEWSDRCWNLVGRCRDVDEFLSAISRRNPEATALNSTRAELVKSIGALRNALRDLGEAFQLQTTGPDYEVGEEDISKAESDRRRRTVEIAYKAWMDQSRGMLRLLSTEITEAWTRVRQMERYALDLAR